MKNLALAGLLLLAAAPGVRAQDSAYTRFVSRARPTDAINVDHNTLTLNAVADTAIAADWILEPADVGYVRIRNRYRNTYIHIEYGTAEAGPIDVDWWSAMWSLVPTADGYVRIRNRWKPTEYLQAQNGALVSGEVKSDAVGAQWKVVKHGAGKRK